MVQVIYSMNDASVHSPEYAHPHDSGMDVFSPVEIKLAPNEFITISTGIRLECLIPIVLQMLGVGVEVHVRGKSGRQRDRIEVSFGTVDEEYRGEVHVTVHNFSNKEVTIAKNEKLCQFVVCPVFNRIKLIKGLVLTNTKRGEGGLGSTGLFKK